VASERALTNEIGKLRMLTERTMKETLARRNFYYSESDGESDPAQIELELESHFKSIDYAMMGDAEKPLQLFILAIDTFSATPNASRTNVSSVERALFGKLNSRGQDFIQTVSNINASIIARNAQAYFLAQAAVSLFLCVVLAAGATQQYQHTLQTSRREEEAKTTTLNQVCHEIRGHMAAVKIALEASHINAVALGNDELLQIVRMGLAAVDAQSLVLQNRLEVRKMLPSATAHRNHIHLCSSHAPLCGALLFVPDVRTAERPVRG
jgi:hypothetical protein